MCVTRRDVITNDDDDNDDDNDDADTVVVDLQPSIVCISFLCDRIMWSSSSLRVHSPMIL